MPAPSLPTILVVDDNADVLTALRVLLGDHGYHVLTALTPDVLPLLLRDEPIDLVLLDMNFRRDASSGKEGFVWLDRILTVAPEVPVVMITAYGDVALAVRAMKHGAVDFVTKPWSNEAVLLTISAALKRQRPDRKPPPADHEAFEALIGGSPSMRALKETIRKVAPTDANVLIVGESGTGKKLVARAIHQLSSRSGGPFIYLNPDALTPSGFEQELSGDPVDTSVKDDGWPSGLFSAANTGTAYLDEIGHFDPREQQRLLIELRRRTIARQAPSSGASMDVRVISATTAPLQIKVREGTFSQDLLYEINTVELPVPPLRDRGDDIELLALYFLRRQASKYQRNISSISPQALAHLHAYRWPGNVRELEHVIERAVILAEKDTLTPDDLLISSTDSHESDADLDLASTERNLIRRALSIHGGNITRAAEALGLSRKGLYRRIEKYGL